MVITLRGPRWHWHEGTAVGTQGDDALLSAARPWTAEVPGDVTRERPPLAHWAHCGR